MRWFFILCLIFIIYQSCTYKPQPDQVFAHEYIGTVTNITYVDAGGRFSSTMQGVVTVGKKTYLMCWIQPKERKISDIPIGAKTWYQDSTYQGVRTQFLYFEFLGNKEHVGYLLDSHQP